MKNIVAGWFQLWSKGCQFEGSNSTSGVIMKLQTSFKAALSLAFVALATACAPSSQTAFNTSADDNSGIIGGTEVPAGSPVHQSTVLIWDTQVGAICTGSILPNNIILTAAHCVGPVPRKHLILFTTKMDQVKDMLTALSKADASSKAALVQKLREVSRPVSKTAVHPQWMQPVKKVAGQMPSTSDLGLMQFEGTLPAGFHPATFVPTPTSAATDFVKPGMVATIAGYGVSTNNILEVKIENTPEFIAKVKSGEYFCDSDEKTNKPSKCFREESLNSGTLHTVDLKMYQRANRNEVVLQQNEGKAACMGDSGGPAYINKGGKLYLWGVASRVSRGCNGFAIYTDATSQFDWMKQTISAMLAAPETVPMAPGQFGPPAPVQPHPEQPAKPKFAI